jgi:hypothetical protein
MSDTEIESNTSSELFSNTYDLDIYDLFDNITQYCKSTGSGIYENCILHDFTNFITNNVNIIAFNERQKCLENIKNKEYIESMNMDNIQVDEPVILTKYDDI